jgi:hypothetical protein
MLFGPAPAAADAAREETFLSASFSALLSISNSLQLFASFFSLF